MSLNVLTKRPLACRKLALREDRAQGLSVPKFKKKYIAKSVQV